MISLNINILNDSIFVIFSLLFGATFIYTCYRSPWGKLKNNLGLQHLCFGASVVLMIIWSIKADVMQGISIHFLAVTVLTLVLGWDLAIVCASVVLAALTFLHHGLTQTSLYNFVANGVITILLPVLISYIVATLVERKLAKNFFIYLFFCGFFCAGLTAVLIGGAISLTLFFSDIYPWLKIEQDVITIIVLTIFPEGLLNGILLTAIMVFYPDWIRSFDAKAYIDDQ